MLVGVAILGIAACGVDGSVGPTTPGPAPTAGDQHPHSAGTVLTNLRMQPTAACAIMSRWDSEGLVDGEDSGKTRDRKDRR
jgi:hypothetical protein